MSPHEMSAENWSLLSRPNSAAGRTCPRIGTSHACSPPWTCPTRAFGRTERLPGTWAHAKSLESVQYRAAGRTLRVLGMRSSGGALTLNMLCIVVTRDTSHALRAELNASAYCNNRGHMQKVAEISAIPWSRAYFAGSRPAFERRRCAHVKHALHRRHPGHVPCIESRVERFGVLQQPWAHAKSR